ncbi:hypothetical protein LTR56_005698 [Elasticomyces elasticus]|nr:hypothetical protein LTR56_005698 [Elasticomyces elasticus]KAK3663915.1 hypothetical protein LTR22_005135 [Elasticomyces elasticus]KAK4927439.1 hypothetical protein LTR49_005844 [Elasticomyces elasticus]KAK5743738.1 hypothetical protein LTS12_023730 [Elasticomyces elasticus]
MGANNQLVRREDGDSHGGMCDASEKNMQTRETMVKLLTAVTHDMLSLAQKALKFADSESGYIMSTIQCSYMRYRIADHRAAIEALPEAERSLVESSLEWLESLVVKTTDGRVMKKLSDGDEARVAEYRALLKSLESLQSLYQQMQKGSAGIRAHIAKVAKSEAREARHQAKRSRSLQSTHHKKMEKPGLDDNTGLESRNASKEVSNEAAEEEKQNQQQLVALDEEETKRWRQRIERVDRASKRALAELERNERITERRSKPWRDTRVQT